MRFFHLKKREKELDKYFKTACEKAGVDYIEIYADEFRTTVDLNIIKGEDLYFRKSTDLISVALEDYLLGIGLPFTTLYKSNFVRKHGISAITHLKEGITVPKTVFRMTTKKDLLKEDIDYLGGFPIILKVVGGTGGVGVIKVESFESLISLTEYLLSLKKKFILREFIPHNIYGRIIVLGDEIVASKRNEIPDNDFRSNEGTPIPDKFSSEIEVLAIKSVSSLGKEFGGVDIIIDQRDGKPYVLEVNMPCNFYNTQNTTGVDIAYEIVEYLKDKATKNL